LIDWFCLFADPGSWNRMFLLCSITLVFTCPLLSWCKISSLFRENINVVVFSFPLHILISLANMVHLHSWIVSHSKDKKFLYLYPIIGPPRRSLVLGRGRFLIREHIQYPPTLAVYCVAHSLPLVGVIEIFPSLKSKSQCIYHTSPVLSERFPIAENYYYYYYYYYY
jgi:hypothetical protein